MMQTTARDVMKALVYPALIVGGCIAACALVDWTHLMWPIVAGILTMGCIAAIVYVRLRWFTSASSIPRFQPRVDSGESAKCVEDLLSQNTQRAAAAAEHLGRMGDAGVVPMLITVLDRSLRNDEPGWEQVCEAIVLALAVIGDGRALPALNRASGARSLKFRAAVESAIASITGLQQHNIAPPEIRPLQDYSRSAIHTGEATPDRATARRAALVPLGDESAFQDSVSE